MARCYLAATGQTADHPSSSTSDSDSLRAYLHDGDNFSRYSSYIQFEDAMWRRRREKGKGRYFFTDLVSNEHFDIDETGKVNGIVNGGEYANIAQYLQAQVTRNQINNRSLRRRQLIRL